MTKAYARAKAYRRVQNEAMSLRARMLARQHSASEAAAGRLAEVDDTYSRRLRRCQPCELETIFTRWAAEREHWRVRVVRN